MQAASHRAHALSAVDERHSPHPLHQRRIALATRSVTLLVRAGARPSRLRRRLPLHGRGTQPQPAAARRSPPIPTVSPACSRLRVTCASCMALLRHVPVDVQCAAHGKVAAKGLLARRKQSSIWFASSTTWPRVTAATTGWRMLPVTCCCAVAFNGKRRPQPRQCST